MTAFGGYFPLCNEVPIVTAQSTKLKLYFAFIPSQNQNNESNQ